MTFGLKAARPPEYFQRRLVAPKYGGWYSSEASKTRKGNLWKVDYHPSRAYGGSCDLPRQGDYSSRVIRAALMPGWGIRFVPVRASVQDGQIYTGRDQYGRHHVL